MSESNQATYELEGSLTIAEVGCVYACLNELLDSDGDILLDAAKLDQVDGAGIQLLAAFALEISNRKRVLSWSGATEELTKSARMVGLTETLGIEPVAN